jgi:ArsR family transcriptional regulator
MDKIKMLKALSDNTRMNIVILLLKYNYCVRALAKKLELSEASISQHLKVLREAGLIEGEKRGYFMHYDVNRLALKQLAKEIEDLSNITKEGCTPSKAIECPTLEIKQCPKKDQCNDEVKSFCHGLDNDK